MAKASSNPCTPANPWLPPELCEYYITQHDVYELNGTCREFLRTEFHVLDYYHNLVTICSNLKEAEHACHVNAVTL